MGELLRDGFKIPLIAWMDGKRTPQQLVPLQTFYRPLESLLRNATTP